MNLTTAETKAKLNIQGVAWGGVGKNTVTFQSPASGDTYTNVEKAKIQAAIHSSSGGKWVEIAVNSLA